jgi:hypothetical protein
MRHDPGRREILPRTETRMIDRFQNVHSRIAEHVRKRNEFRMLMREDDAFFREIGISRADLRVLIFDGRRPD